jgi:indole-3-glycerol phosphate synthase
VAVLSAEELASLHAAAAAAGLAALVEVHDELELEAALAVGAELIGINNRDLTTLEVDTNRTFALRPRIPSGKVVVAESGFSSREQLGRLAAAGVDAVLIGEALMRAPDLEAATQALTGL